MKAIQIEKVTTAEDVVLSDLPMPQVKAGWVLVKVHGFGMNHSEQILRLSEIEAPYIQSLWCRASNAWVRSPIPPIPPL